MLLTITGTNGQIRIHDKKLVGRLLRTPNIRFRSFTCLVDNKVYPTADGRCLRDRDVCSYFLYHRKHAGVTISTLLAAMARRDARWQ